ncbi:hypothetical protein BJ508DRAFT_137981 [Ascobolus immersus RN42]|uniref:Uncharacterized protein n=1 Tax=Ascobolus immersus RN42 TaxID=1160509 RepID=A0A3N4I165_ASCIM|nr:hypothetical protein BJ508DRAFT_137981 [Ascobolus immersus RN42]
MNPHQCHVKTDIVSSLPWASFHYIPVTGFALSVTAMCFNILHAYAVVIEIARMSASVIITDHKAHYICTSGVRRNKCWWPGLSMDPPRTSKRPWATATIVCCRPPSLFLSSELASCLMRVHGAQG